MAQERIRRAWKTLVPILASISVEPVFLLDGFAFSNMVVHVESLQFDKICKVDLNYTDEICQNFDSYPEEEHQYNIKVSNFKRNDGAITSVIPLFFILFIGAWSDKYGRKVPLCLTLFCHILFSGGYLLNAYFFTIPVNFLLIVGFLDSIGGGAVAFLTVSNAYISDVTTTEQRTSRVALANSLWFLGGPLGTLIGTEIFKLTGYTAVFSTSFILYIIAFIYVAVLLPESHGPFADKERLRKISKPKPTIRLRDTIIRVYGLSKKQKSKLGKTESEEEKEYRKSLTWRKMFMDFFDVRRVFMSFQCVFKKRDGFTRLFIFLLIFSNFLRKIGRGAYAFYFTKEVLKWQTVDYGYWVTYKNFLSTIGSLFAVPILSSRLKVSDNTLAMIGSVSSIVDYFLYGLVRPSTYYLMWLAPATSLLVNSCSIAMRAMMSKYVAADELGQVSAVTGTVEGIVPIISTSLYSAITKSTFDTYPGAQYFFGSTLNIVMALIFVFIMMLDKSEDYDLEKAKPKERREPVQERAIVMRKDSNWLFDEYNNNKIRLATILLTALNFSIEVPSIERVYSNKEKKKLSIIGEEIMSMQNGYSYSPTEESNYKQNGISFNEEALNYKNENHDQENYDTKISEIHDMNEIKVLNNNDQIPQEEKRIKKSEIHNMNDIKESEIRDMNDTKKSETHDMNDTKQSEIHDINDTNKSEIHDMNEIKVLNNNDQIYENKKETEDEDTELEKSTKGSMREGITTAEINTEAKSEDEKCYENKAFEKENP